MAEGDYLDYVQSKLLPHKLSFDCHPTPFAPTWDTYQATRAESSSHLVTVDTPASATFSSTGSLQVGSCNTSNTATLSVVAQTDSTNDVVETRDKVPYEAPFRADCAVDRRSSSPHFTTRSDHFPYESAATESIAREMSFHHESYEHTISEDRPFRGIPSIAREVDHDVPPHVTVFRSSTYEETLEFPPANNTNSPFPISIDKHPLPSHVYSTTTSPSLPSSCPSPQAEHELIWPEGSPQTPYAQCVQRLDILHPDVQIHIPSIIELGDNFFQEDIVTFVKSFCCKWSHSNLCYRSEPNLLAGEDPRIKNLVSHYFHAQAFKRRSVVDRFKLRFTRVLLYQEFEELRIYTQDNLVKYGLLSSGQDAASFATDQILDKSDIAYCENIDTRTSQQKRQCFRRHRSIGKRWSIIASHFGPGIFLICSYALEAQM